MKEECIKDEELSLSKEEDLTDRVEDTGEELEERIEELESSLKRVMADFDNYRKRMNNEKKKLIALANESMVSDLLSVIDDFERALENDNALDKEGLEMIFRKFKSALKEHGLENLECEGKDFDPNYHECIISEEVEEEEHDKVLEEIQKGYLLNSNLIRPAKVKVGKYIAEKEEVKEDE